MPAPRTGLRAQAPADRPSSLAPTKTLRVSAGDPGPARAASPRARSLPQQPAEHRDEAVRGVGREEVEFHELGAGERLDRQKIDADDAALALGAADPLRRDLGPSARRGAKIDRERWARRAGFHQTDTVDYAIVLEGEVYAVLDESETLISGASSAMISRVRRSCAGFTNEKR